MEVLCVVVNLFDQSIFQMCKIKLNCFSNSIRTYGLPRSILKWTLVRSQLHKCSSNVYAVQMLINIYIYGALAYSSGSLILDHSYICVLICTAL